MLRGTLEEEAKKAAIDIDQAKIDSFKKHTLPALKGRGIPSSRIKALR
jgi:hypothetical protein